MAKAIVIGATGLIGKELVRQLSQNDHYHEVVILTRRAISNLPANCVQYIINFDDLGRFKSFITGDVLFSTLGTTLRKAGSKEAQYKIDFDYQFNVCKIAAENGVQKMVLLSSAGANSKSSIFYSRMKGELDDAVKKLSFRSVSVIRPSMLVGKREEFRLGEKIFTPLGYILTVIPFVRKYRPIRDKVVASAMIHAAQRNAEAYKIYELEDVFRLAK